MKSAGHWDEHKRDELLFKYLEGELSAQETAELEKALASDAALQGELDLWREAYVSAEFYPTEPLEKSLLQTEVQTIRSSTVSVFVLTLLSSLLSFLPLAEQTQAPIPASPVREFRPAEQTVLDFPEISQPAPAIQVLSRPLPATPGPENPTPVTDFPQYPVVSALPAPMLLPLPVSGEPADLPGPASGAVKPAARKTPVPRTISRKEQRQIERMKEKARQQRMADQFRKGRVPYVVPLNTKSF
jgi:hypothetical protein